MLASPARACLVHWLGLTRCPRIERANEKVRDTVPKRIHLPQCVFFGDVWERPELCQGGQSLITFAALSALHGTEQGASRPCGRPARYPSSGRLAKNDSCGLQALDRFRIEAQ